MIEDRLMQELAEAAVAGIPAPGLRVRVSQGVVCLSGTVRNDADRRHAEQMVRQVEGVRSVQNELVVSLLPEEYGTPSDRGSYAVAQDELEETAVGESPELDLNQPAGTTDPLLPEVEPEEPYFPPTDPVIEPLGRAEGGYRVLGGYAESSMDRPLGAEPAPARLQQSDDQVAENVQLALKEDAATTDLEIHVHARNGVVYLHGKVRYLQDVEAAEEVAGRVAGVREVQEQLELE